MFPLRRHWCLPGCIVVAVIEILRDFPHGLVAIALLAAGIVGHGRRFCGVGTARVLAAGGRSRCSSWRPSSWCAASDDRFGFGLVAIALLSSA